MGYTHYLELSDRPAHCKTPICSEAQAQAYLEAIIDCGAIVRASPVNLGNWEGLDSPLASALEGISLNGDASCSDAHETFELSSSAYDLRAFQCCKTAAKPYDLIVVACLAVIADRCSDFLTISSDGGSEEWVDGCMYASTILKRKICIPSMVER